MTEHVTSADGTSLAVDRWGEGPPVVVVGGMLTDRTRTAALARAMAERVAVVHPDRRGRGGSDDAARAGHGSAAADAGREVEDVAALVAAAGAPAALYGHSSGAAVALRAAAAGAELTCLVLHEPPFADDAGSVTQARGRATAMLAALASGRPEDCLRLFLRDVGLPDDAVEAAAADPAMRALAPSMAYDVAALDEVETGGALPADLVRAVRVPTLLLVGGASPDFFRRTTERIAGLLPDATTVVLDGQDHGAPPDVVAPVVADFVAAHARGVVRRA